MKVSEAFPSNYLKAADLQGRTVKAVIDTIKSEDLGGDQKLIMYFRGKEKGLVLNKTNASTIAMAFGDDTDNWSGAPIELFPQSVPFNGQMVPAIRVRIPAEEPAARSAPAPERVAAGARYDERTPPPRDLDEEIPF